jgi:hypothetical protein
MFDFRNIGATRKGTGQVSFSVELVPGNVAVVTRDNEKTSKLTEHDA